MEKTVKNSENFNNLMTVEELNYENAIEFENFAKIITKIMTQNEAIGRYYSLVHTHSKVNPILRVEKYKQSMEHLEDENNYSIDFSNKITDFVNIEKDEFMREYNQLAIRIYKNLSNEIIDGKNVQVYDKKMTCIYDIDMNEICEIIDFDSKQMPNNSIKRNV